MAIVTGASRGIGRAIAERYAEMGCNLIVNSLRDEDALVAFTSGLVERHKVEIEAILGSVAEEAVAQKLMKTAHSRFGRLDVMVNNAGVLRDGMIGMIQSADVDETLDVNLRGVINGIQVASRLMRRNKAGSIINLSSIIGRAGNAGQLVYGASKAGVIGATKSAAKELAPSGIRVNAIAPGYIDTDMIRNIPQDVHKERLASIAMGRVGTPEDIADTALFLASDMSSYVTGQVIGVDGGMLI